MILQKICFCVLSITVVFSFAQAQSHPKASLNYVSSFANRMHPLRSAEGGICSEFPRSTPGHYES